MDTSGSFVSRCGLAGVSTHPAGYPTSTSTDCGHCYAQAQCTDAQLAAFKDWPLLPTTSGKLCYVAYRSMLFLPPRSYIVEESDTHEEWPWLLPLLERIQCPVLDTAQFPQCRAVCAPLAEWDQYTPADLLLQKLMQVRCDSIALSRVSWFHST